MQRQDRIIYIDWNIFQDIKHNRQVIGLKECLDQAKKRGYIIPYSSAHLEDISRSDNSKYIAEDLKWIEAITGNYCLAYNEKDEKDFWLMNKKPEKIKQETKSQYHLKKILVFEPYCVNMNCLQESNILFPYLKRNNNIMSSELLVEIIYDLYYTIFDDPNIEKKFRNSIHELRKLNEPAFPYMKDFPIWKYLFSNQEILKEHFIEIMESFLYLSNKKLDTLPFGETITTAYDILNFFPVFAEKINNKNNIHNTSSDSAHTYWATSSKYFITNDKHLLKKACFIYNVFGIKTKIYMKDDFIKNVSFL